MKNCTSDIDLQKKKGKEYSNIVYQIYFFGSKNVGKSSIIDEFMSSENTDVFEEKVKQSKTQNTR